MSVLITGMKMPEHCMKCRFIFGRNDCTLNRNLKLPDPDWFTYEGRPDGCPLIEVPPHGKLIDIDETGILQREEAFYRQHKEDPDNEYFEGLYDGYHKACRTLSFARPIIPADKENET